MIVVVELIDDAFPEAVIYGGGGLSVRGGYGYAALSSRPLTKKVSP